MERRQSAPSFKG